METVSVFLYISKTKSPHYIFPARLKCVGTGKLWKLRFSEPHRKGTGDVKNPNLSGKSLCLSADHSIVSDITSGRVPRFTWKVLNCSGKTQWTRKARCVSYVTSWECAGNTGGGEFSVSQLRLHTALETTTRSVILTHQFALHSQNVNPIVLLITSWTAQTITFV